MSENTTERDERLRAIRERTDAATEGPWFRQYGDVVLSRLDPSLDEEEDYNERVMLRPRHLDLRDPQAIATAEFVAHAPEDVRYLLALLAERDAQVQRVRREHLRESVHALADECGHPDDDAHDTFESRDGDRLCVDAVVEDGVCATCCDGDGDPVVWPCSTIRALDGGAS